jgi:hypothetical protein
MEQLQSPYRLETKSMNSRARAVCHAYLNTDMLSIAGCLLHSEEEFQNI